MKIIKYSIKEIFEKNRKVPKKSICIARMISNTINNYNEYKFCVLEEFQRTHADDYCRKCVFKGSLFSTTMYKIYKSTK